MEHKTESKLVGEKIAHSNTYGGFLQSDEWLKFQESVGRKTYRTESGNFKVGIIEHELPIVGRYFYIPRGSVLNVKRQMSNVKSFLDELIELAKENNVGWIRIDPIDSHILDLIRSNWRVVKAPHDMQPRENFVIDISKSEEELLAEMKSKTRYNIRLSQKQGVSVKAISASNCHPERSEGSRVNSDSYNLAGFFADAQNDDAKKCVNAFLRLTKEMAVRQGINAHPEEYYRKMIAVLPCDMLKIYVAEYENKIIAANLVLFYPHTKMLVNNEEENSKIKNNTHDKNFGVRVCGNTATYLHGASGNEHRNLMAPYLLQWQAILDAKKRGCKFYDFGGISTNHEPKTKNWQGITKFKLGFSPNTEPTLFPGSFDVIINSKKYFLYLVMQKIKSLVVNFLK